MGLYCWGVQGFSFYFNHSRVERQRVRGFSLLFVVKGLSYGWNVILYLNNKQIIISMFNKCKYSFVFIFSDSMYFINVKRDSMDKLEFEISQVLISALIIII